LAHTFVQAHRVLAIAAQIQAATGTPEVIALLKAACACLGLNGAMFSCCIRDDAATVSHRHLIACEPTWASHYAHNGCSQDDPWLRYARYSTRPILARDLPLLNEREIQFTLSAARQGFNATIVVPAPSAVAQSRFGVLCMGSTRDDFFQPDALVGIAVLARVLAMELGDWMHRQVGSELIAQARITRADVHLLQLAQHDPSSKSIAAALDLAPKTVDCRLSRLAHRLGVANRHAAVRLAEIYGLI
jgi:DNA-binding CsgD family transcriptional regulator